MDDGPPREGHDRNDVRNLRLSDDDFAAVDVELDVLVMLVNTTRTLELEVVYGELAAFFGENGSAATGRSDA